MILCVRFRSHTLSYDEYGFSLRPIYEFDQNLEAAAKNLQKISDELSCKAQVLALVTCHLVSTGKLFLLILVLNCHFDARASVDNHYKCVHSVLHS